ncbi:hypothetical protein AOY89_07845 [Escherichia coli]|nr:hypothetical protein AOY89_07845 [Escherichia coli]
MRGDSFLSVFWLWFEASYSHSADFLQQRNGALSVGILYFLAGSVMCHPDVVNIAKNDIEINHILSKTWKYILNRRTRRFFLFLLRTKKRHEHPGILVGQGPWLVICERVKKGAAVGLKPRDKVHEES